jgi:single-stranded-DNA-specific exonuclease
MNQSDWYIYDQDDMAEDFLSLIQTITQQTNCHYLARLLWNRGIREIQALEDLLGSNNYQSISYLELGEEVNLALERIAQARFTGEKVAIWGNWQVVSIMTTCVLKEGLEQFFGAENQLIYHFPDRQLSYFGLNYESIDRLIEEGINLIITANLGSDNLEEINYAHSKGLDIIIIDRPCFSCQRPSVVAWLNSHDLAYPNLPVIAIVYKLLEGLATQYPETFSQPISNVLDLVALGLLADKVNLQTEGCYLAKEGIKLIKQKKRHNITKIAENCFQIGDRALDISYGLINRIKAITSIYTEISFILKLFTCSDIYLINRLVNQAEKAYLNYLDLVQKMLNQARQKIKSLDLSNTSIIFLEHYSWHSGLFPFLAEILIPEFGKPLILISNQSNNSSFAYIYSLPELDLSPAIIKCHHLLDQFIITTDHINLILPTENMALFQEILAQQIRYDINPLKLKYQQHIDLLLNLNELKESLYQELKLLEPYNSFDNPFPKLLITNCQLKNINYVNLKNQTKNLYTNYKKIYFDISDRDSSAYFSGIWWTHSPQEINDKDSYDLLGELEYNTERDIYYLRLLDLKKSSSENYIYPQQKLSNNIIDYRYQKIDLDIQSEQTNIIKKCPSKWQQITLPYQKAINKQEKLILAYNHNEQKSIEQKWLEFLGLIKYLLATHQIITLESLSEKINITLLSLQKIVRYLHLLNIEYTFQDNLIILNSTNNHFSPENYQLFYEQFVQIIKQENLYKQYFYQVSVNDLEQEIDLLNRY